MSRPQSNGLIELVDEKSHDRGFFCMTLFGYLWKEQDENPDKDRADLWEIRFGQAKNGQCHYKAMCPVHARAMAKRLKDGVQLSLEFL